MKVFVAKYIGEAILYIVAKSSRFVRGLWNCQGVVELSGGCGVVSLSIHSLRFHQVNHFVISQKRVYTQNQFSFREICLWKKLLVI